MSDQVAYMTTGPIATVSLLLVLLSTPVLLVGTLLGESNIIGYGLMIFLVGFVLAPVSNWLEQ